MEQIVKILKTQKPESENGNILVSSLLVLLAMNILAIALVQTSQREFVSANYKTVDSTNFYLAETCIQEGIKYFEGLDEPPATLNSITKSNISHLYNGAENNETTNQLSRYSYNCDITSLTAKSEEAKETGIGSNVSVSDGYGISGDLNPTYYYRINSTGTGPDGSSKGIISIVSVKY